MATFVVATDGLDTTGTGSTANPWRTVLKALNTVAPGDTIEQRGGTYSGPGDTFSKNSRDTVTIQNYANEDVTNQQAATGSSGNIWAFENCRPGGILVRKNPAGGSLTFRHSPAPPIPTSTVAPGGKFFRGIFTQYAPGSPSTVEAGASTAPALTVDGVTVTDMRSSCIAAFQTGVVVRNCDLSHGSIGVYVQLNVGYEGPGVLIENNHIHHMDKLFQDNRVAGEGADSGAMGIALDRHRGLAGPAVMRGNLIHDCTCYSSMYGRDGGALEVYRSALWNFYGNELHDNEDVIETGTDPNNATFVNLPGGSFHHNYCHGFMCTDAAGPSLLFRTGNGHKIYNNTFVMDGGNYGPTPHVLMWFASQGGGFGEAVQNSDVFNNIIANGPVVNSPGNQLIWATRASGAATPTFTRLDYNLLYSPYGTATTAVSHPDLGVFMLSAAGLTSWRAASPWSDHDQWNVNPLLNADGTLPIGSPAVNAGLHVAGLTDGFYGTAPDIGAFEYSPAATSASANAIPALGIGAANGAGAKVTGRSSTRITMS